METNWVDIIPDYFRPNHKKINELEKLRKDSSIPQEVFAKIVLSSPEITKKALKINYKQYKELLPDAEEKELLMEVFKRRRYPQNPLGIKMTESQIKSIFQKIHSIDDLIQIILEFEKDEPRFETDFLGIGQKVAENVDRILKE